MRMLAVLFGALFLPTYVEASLPRNEYLIDKDIRQEMILFPLGVIITQMVVCREQSVSERLYKMHSVDGWSKLIKFNILVNRYYGKCSWMPVGIDPKLFIYCKGYVDTVCGRLLIFHNKKHTGYGFVLPWN